MPFIILFVGMLALHTARMYAQNKHWWEPASDAITGVITEEYSVNVEDAE